MATLSLVALVFFGLPPATRAAGTVYVTNLGSEFVDSPDHTVSQYAIGAGGELSSLSPPAVAAGYFAENVAVTPDGKSAYVTNDGDDTISQYDIDPLSGALSPKTPATIDTAAFPWDLAITPDGKSAYVVGASLPGTVSEYSIDPLTGALSPKPPTTLDAGISPFGVAVTPDGKSAYVTNFECMPTETCPNGVLQYTINADGTLSPKTPASVASVPGPYEVTVTPDGKSAYVTSLYRGSISQYNIDPLSGDLSPKSPTTLATGSGRLAVSPDGKSAYATSGANTVTQYDIDPLSGALSPKTPESVTAGNGPYDLTVTSDGKSVYVTNIYDGTVSQYNVDPLSGRLSPKIPATVATGFRPSGVAAGSFPFGQHSTTTSVTCSPSTVPVGESTTCAVTVTDTAPSNQTTPTGTVELASSGSGSFSTRSCALSGSGASSSCRVTYMPRAVGSGGHTITANYDPDATHATSTGNTIVGVTTRSTSTSLSCAVQTVVAGHSTTCTATVTDTANSGQTTPTGTVSITSSGPGAFGGGGSCTLTAASSSSASCQLTYTPSAVTATPVRSDTITASYSDDSTHATSSGTQSVTVLSITLLVQGSFVIGDQNARLGNAITFWGAHWWKLNSLSDGRAPADFKGFASHTPNNPPQCGDYWTTEPGGSSNPPATVPEFMAVIASSSITKSGPTVSGDAPEVVVVKTDDGHPGKGTVAGIVCGG